MTEETPDQVEPMEQVSQEPQEADTTEETNEAVDSSKTEEEDPRVAELEKKFEDRYTEKDPAFKAVLESKEASPPVVPNYGGSSDRGRDRDRKRSRSRSPTATIKRKGMFDCYSYFVYYY